MESISEVLNANSVRGRLKRLFLIILLTTALLIGLFPSNSSLVHAYTEYGLLADINTGSGSSSVGARYSTIDGFVKYGGRMYFTAYDGVHGREIWWTDGTTTQMLADIDPGTSTAHTIWGLTVVGDYLYFRANNDLYRYDANTDSITDLDIGLSPSGIYGYNGNLYISGLANNTQGRELFVYHPSSGTSELLVDFDATAGVSSYANVEADLNGNLIVSAYRTDVGDELWKVDPTSGAYELISDINPGASSTFGEISVPWVGSFYSFNNQLYFKTPLNSTLWIYDGNNLSTVPNFAWTGGRIAEFQDKLYLLNSLTGYEGTYSIDASGDIALVLSGTSGRLVYDGHGILVVQGQNLYEFNNGTLELVDTLSIVPGAMTLFNGLIYFAASESSTGHELWTLYYNKAPKITYQGSNTGDEGANLLLKASVNDRESDALTHTWSILSGPDDGGLCTIADPQSLNTTITCTDDGTVDVQLEVSDGINDPVFEYRTFNIINVAPSVSFTNPASGSQVGLNEDVVVSVGLFEHGSNDTYALCEFEYEGVIYPGSITMTSDECTATINSGTNWGDKSISVTVSDDDGGTTNKSVGFYVPDPRLSLIGTDVHSIVGKFEGEIIAGRFTASGNELISTVNQQSIRTVATGITPIWHIGQLDGQYYFMGGIDSIAAYDTNNLLVTDGQTVSQVSDFGDLSSSGVMLRAPRQNSAVSSDGVLMFTARTDDNNTSLWGIDSGAVVNIDPSINSPYNYIKISDKVYFGAEDNGRQIFSWDSTDGTVQQTYSSLGSSFTGMIFAKKDNLLYFVNSYHFTPVVRTFDTNTNTLSSNYIYFSGNPAETVTDFQFCGDNLYAITQDGSDNLTLYSVDYTNYTSQSITSVNFQEFGCVGDQIFFNKEHAIAGMELWTLNNGTPEMIANIAPGADINGDANHGYPTYFTESNGKLFFIANDSNGISNLYSFNPNINTPGATLIGSDKTVVVTTASNTLVTFNFDQVNAAGQTTVTESSTGPAIPQGFTLGDPPTYFELATTATFSGEVEVCFNYSNLSFSSTADLRLMHYENGAWTDVTSGLYETRTVVCGSVSSFSPFAIVEKTNEAPKDLVIDAPLAPQSINSNVTVSASFIDTDQNDTHTATIDWGDGSTSDGQVSFSSGNGSVVGEHMYSSAGIYIVSMTVTDSAGESVNSSHEFIVVYDPDGGFVTGGGWFESPLGAYLADTELEGKASFGFNSKYLNGATVPSGTTQFTFTTADLKFKSTDYEWMVISGGKKAQYKGSGTINGDGSYRFMLTAWDGDSANDGESDKLRIRIWENSTGNLVYDNQLGSDENADPSTAISGGSIVIHKP